MKDECVMMTVFFDVSVGDPRKCQASKGNP